MHIHLVGPLPPPYGGVSVHIHRLRSRLLRAGHECSVWGNHERPDERVFAISSTLKGLRELRRQDADAVFHFHANYLLAGLLARKRRRVLFTVHNQRINQILHGGRFPKQWLYRQVAGRAFRKVPRLIAVSELARDELVRFGFARPAVSVINAYLRPEEDEQAHPANVEAFGAFRQRFGVIATANAWALRFHEGADLYGIDMCLELLRRLCTRRPEFGIVLAVPIGKGTPYFAELHQRANEFGVAERVLWLTEAGAYQPILRQCDLFLRPTNTDGFCISIAESCEFGIPIVASDAAVRPQGCLLFSTRDMDDFAAKVEQALDKGPLWSQRSLASKEPDHFAEILAIYESLAQADPAG